MSTSQTLHRGSPSQEPTKTLEELPEEYDELDLENVRELQFHDQNYTSRGNLVLEEDGEEFTARFYLEQMGDRWELEITEYNDIHFEDPFYSEEMEVEGEPERPENLVYEFLEDQYEHF